MTTASPYPLYSFLLLVLIFTCHIAVCYKVKLLRENASQSYSNIGYFWPARRALDGNTGLPNPGRSTCTLTNLAEKAWWRVKLNGLYVVESVRLFSRRGVPERFKNFDVRVGNTSEVASQELCRHYPGQFPEANNINFTCVQKIYGEYVSVQLRGKDYLTLCEVEVYGYRVCQAGYFKDDCIPCNCKDVCFLETGKCPSSCIAGWRGADCQQACEPRFWGEKCVNNCMCQDSREACNATNGFCNSRCRDYLAGTGCNKQLPTVDSIRPTTLSSRSIAVAWKPSEAQGEDQLSATSFTIQYRPKEATTAWKNKTVGTDGTGPPLNHTVSGLMPNKTYVFRVVPKSMYVGVQYDGKPSKVSSGTKTSCEAPVAPSVLKRDVLCDSDGRTVKIDVSWENFDMDGHRCKSWRSLSVVYQVKSEDTPKEKKVPDIRATSTAIYFTTPRNVRYNLRMKVSNDENIANYSAWVMGIDISNKCKADYKTNIGPLIGCFLAGSAFVLIINLIVYVVIRIRRRQKKSNKGGSANSTGNVSGYQSKERRIMSNTEAEPYEEVATYPHTTRNEAGGVQEIRMGEHTYDKLDPEATAASPYQNVKEATSRTPMYESLAK